VKVLVTTPNGKVGHEVVKQLLANGVSVRAGVHNPAKADGLTALGAEVVHFDFADASSVQAALSDIDRLYLAFPGTLPFEQPKAVVDAAKAAGVKRIVQLSAKGVENSDTLLRQVEQYLEASGLEYTLLRPNWFFQNFNTGQREYIRQAGAIIEAAGDGRTSFIDTRDIAAVAVKALTEDGHHGKAYALTGSVAHHRSEVAAAISKATGKTVVYKPLSDEAFRAQATAEQWPVAVIETMSWLYGGVRAGWTQEVVPTVKELLGREPIGLEQYVQDHKKEWL
jgi:uncharacterized protein YbjT (DUF2867 family)